MTQTLILPSLPLLAPMAGVADYAFRSICRELGAGGACSEMVSARALVYQDKKTLSLLRREGRPFGVQLFGNEPDIMAQAAKKAVEVSGADYIDVNMGCPIPKIVNNGDGCALMRDIPLAARIISAVCGAVNVPVTAKFRLGWDKGSLNAPELASALEDAGAAAVCVHGRTRAQLYSGEADWFAIRRVKSALRRIPLIASGDVRSPESMARCLRQSGADAVMIGRAAFGNPFIFRELRALVLGETPPPPPTLAEKCATAVRQFELAASVEGERLACLNARKHYAWYLRGVPHASFYKNRVTQVSTLADIYAVTADILRDCIQ